mgnify:CR=1 FL=1
MQNQRGKGTDAKTFNTQNQTIRFYIIPLYQVHLGVKFDCFDAAQECMH